MINKNLSFATAVIVLILIAGCKGDTGPAGPSLTGSITGIVQLYDSTGNMPIDRSGVTIAIQGTSLSTTTDSLGLWTINNVTTGTYTITETKPGYGMSEQQGFVFVGDTEDDYIPNRGYISMSQPPDFSGTIDSIKTIPDSGIHIWYTMTGNLYPANDAFLVLIGNDSTVNPSNPQTYSYEDFTSTGTTPSSEYNATSSEIRYGGFKSGSTAYLILCALENNGSEGPAYSSYYDIATGRTAYTSIGPSAKVFKVTIP